MAAKRKQGQPNPEQYTNEDKNVGKQKGIFLTEDHIATICVIAYFIIVLLTYGSISAKVERDRCQDFKGLVSCKEYEPFAGFLAPLAAGVIWPVYYPFVAAKALFL